jgi:membrane protein YqaA with SNARE-associated domain
MAEAFAVAIGLVKPTQLAVPMWIVFTVGHVAAKVPWYFLGTRGDRVMGAWVARYVVRARELLRARPTYGTGVLTLSALLSIPPFHLSAIAAGITHLPVGRFVLICLAGRLVRFGVLAATPGLLRGWWG